MHTLFALIQSVEVSRVDEIQKALAVPDVPTSVNPDGQFVLPLGCHDACPDASEVSTFPAPWFPSVTFKVEPELPETCNALVGLGVPIPTFPAK